MIVISQLLVFCCVLIFRFRWGVGVFVLFLAFSPRSLGLFINGGTLSVTFSRLAFPLLLVLYIAASLVHSSSNAVKPRGIFSERPFQILLLLSLIKLAASALNGINLTYALNEVLLSTGVFATFYWIATKPLQNTINNAILLTTGLLIMVVFLEYFSQKPLHFSLVNKVAFAQEILEARFRSGRYRAQGIFDNPLSLAEFCVYALPLVLAVAIRGGQLQRSISLFLLLGIFGMILASGSRSGLLVGSLTTVVFILAYQWERLTFYSRVFSWLSLFGIAVYATVTSMGLIVSLASDASGLMLYEVEDEMMRSAFSRALQYYQIFETITNHPFIGHGVYQNYAREMDAINRIDNYYLRVGMEAGFIGIGLFVALLVSLALHVQTQLRRTRDREALAQKAMLLGLIASFAFMKLFLSMPTNNIYFYLLAGTALGEFSRKRMAARSIVPMHLMSSFRH